MSFCQSDFLNSPGVLLAADGALFRVYSRHATIMDLCLYDSADGTCEVARCRMERGGMDVWFAFVPGVRAGQLYGYRAHGPWMPHSALRYNPNKLLLDPYARAIAGTSESGQVMLGVDGPHSFPGSYDNGAVAFKSIVVDEAYDWQSDDFPRVPWAETIVYELHVKGFTKLHPGVPEHLRGTYAGLAHPCVIDYFKQLGVTSLQLLPVHQHLDDQFLLEKGLTNYWGYNTVGFFAPHSEYAAASDPQEQVREFKDMVKVLHAAGIEVILDVVYNHTAEGDERGPTLMFRGLDDRMYYRHTFDERGANYINVTGCGNAVDSASPPGLRLIMDSLRYWVTEMHVDGFRFDLAVTVARDQFDHFDANSQFLAAVVQDPILSKVKLIAEPWDIMRMDSYQVGAFPEPWRELNGKYRDTVRKFWSGNEDSTAEFAKRLCGSQDIYGMTQGPALRSVNFITSHDGFTLLDLVSYASKHNEANGERNLDGDNQNHSLNCGVEGETDDERVLGKRARLRRSLLATLMSSVGVPFLVAGDELGRTQKGNNNAYCQDNELSWIDWNQIDDEMLAFTRQIIALRRETPALRRREFFDGVVNPLTGLPDVAWLDGRGTLLCHEEWHDPVRTIFGALIAASPPLVFLFNRGDLPQSFILPGSDEAIFNIVYDTAESPAFSEGEEAPHRGGSAFPLQSHSMVCLRLSAGSLRLLLAC